AEIERALLVALQKRTNVALYEETFVSKLIMRAGKCAGVEAVAKDGHTFTITAQATVLANGGAGGLWLHTSNPSGATADGLALAWRAGAALTDLEFMQFHPTVLVVGGSSHLISEAVRGEGAYLRNHAGERFMLRYSPQAELASRDVVARAILSEMLAEKTDCQYLDLRHLPAAKMHARFPTISTICRGYGLDLAQDLLPIAPAAHYCMGGVIVDTYGRTTLAGLYAVGEVACTGVHGANRLASNSLLEGLVFGLRVADVLASAALPVATLDDRSFQYVTFAENEVGQTAAKGNVIQDASTAIAHIRRDVRSIMWQYVSLCRDQVGLLQAQRNIQHLRALMFSSMPGISEHGEPLNAPQWIETANMLQVAELVIAAALQRHESRGSHWRSDYETLDATLAGRHYAFMKDTSTDKQAIPLEEVIAHA
ncbi:MAG: L-aspartate oxidase, partial [Ktedonobacteraceae bacterium]